MKGTALIATDRHQLSHPETRGACLYFRSVLKILWQCSLCSRWAWTLENHSSRPQKCRRTFLHIFRNLCLRQVRLSAVAQNLIEVLDFLGSSISHSPVRQKTINFICFPIFFFPTMAALVSVANSIKSIEGALRDLICDNTPLINYRSTTFLQEIMIVRILFICRNPAKQMQQAIFV